MDVQQNIVGVVRDDDKLAGMQKLLDITQFRGVLTTAFERSGKRKEAFKIVIKPNMMVFINPRAFSATVTDKDLVEALVDEIRGMGFTEICLCEAQNDVGTMLKNHNVSFVADKIGYRPAGRYQVVDLTLESEPYAYAYTDDRGRTRKWVDCVGKTWRDADFRVTFAKCKTHEHDWMTLGVKNVYGCFPSPNKVSKYHIRYEVPDVTARSVRAFPIHFSFVDAWLGSDGFQGYKINHPRELKMLFGGKDAVAVDMEIFKRAGLEPHKSKILRCVVEQAYGGTYPTYDVKGDQSTLFRQLGPWDNISDEIVEGIDILEEVYISWGFINLKPIATVIDLTMFPPRNIFIRFLVWLSKGLYGIFKMFRFYRKLYSRSRQRRPAHDR